MVAGNDPIKLALGYSDYIDDFADIHNALTWGDIDADATLWAATFLRIMNLESTTAVFNLQGIANCWFLASSAVNSKTPNTAWELYQIYSNRDWWPRISWFEGMDLMERGNPFA